MGNNSFFRIEYQGKRYFDCQSLDFLEIEEGAKVLAKDIFIKLWPLLHLIHQNEHPVTIRIVETKVQVIAGDKMPEVLKSQIYKLLT